MALDTKGLCGQLCGERENSTAVAGITIRPKIVVPRYIIIEFIYFAKYVSCVINPHYHKASKLASICVP